MLAIPFRTTMKDHRNIRKVDDQINPADRQAALKQGLMDDLLTGRVRVTALCSAWEFSVRAIVGGVKTSWKWSWSSSGVPKVPPRGARPIRVHHPVSSCRIGGISSSHHTVLTCGLSRRTPQRFRRPRRTSLAPPECQAPPVSSKTQRVARWTARWDRHWFVRGRGLHGAGTGVRGSRATADRPAHWHGLDASRRRSPWHASTNRPQEVRPRQFQRSHPRSPAQGTTPGHQQGQPRSAVAR